MSNIEVIHTDHIKPAHLKAIIRSVLELSQKIMTDNPEEGEGWLLVNTAMALRAYNMILEQAYVQSLREGYGGGKPPLAAPSVTQIHDETIIDFRNQSARYTK